MKCHHDYRTLRGYRAGNIMSLAAVLLVVMLGMVAISIDVGWMILTRTQLQAASDSGSLAGGTELLPGLGHLASKTPAEVKLAAEAQAKLFTEVHQAGNVSRIFIEPSRDVDLGKGSLDTATGVWSFQEGVTPYNAVRVRTHRNSTGTTARDGPLPYFIAHVLGQGSGEISAESMAVILPASGIRIPPDSEISSGLAPFAFSLERWEKYLVAADYYKTLLQGGRTAGGVMPSDIKYTIMTDGNGDPILDPVTGHKILDLSDPPVGTPIIDANGQHELLFYDWVETGNSGVFETRPLFTDNQGVDYPDQKISTINSIPDQILEVNIYPLASESGNFGTVDIGGLDNSTADLSNQIRNGISGEDLVDYANNTFDPENNFTQLQGDTGISGGLEHALSDVVGHCKAIVLYSAVQNPGNNALYTIERLQGTRFMSVDLSGQDKLLVIQPCKMSDGAGVPDYDEDIGEDTSFFTPLILGL